MFRKNLPVLLSLFLLALLALWHLIFALRTQVYFSQDDFAVFAYFKQYSPLKLFWRFLTFGDIWSFHKVIGFINFRILFHFFGTNHLAYLLHNHILHTLNLFLVYLIIIFFTKDYFKPLFFSIIFNRLYLSYFSNVHEYLVTLFSLLSIYIFFRFPKYRFVSVLSFILGLLTKEVALAVPLMLWALIRPKDLKIKQLFPYLVVSFLYLIYQFSFIQKKASLPADHPYLLCFQAQCWINNLRFYLSSGELLLIFISLFLSFSRKTYWILIASLFSLIPALLLKQRLETYYLYLPLAYLCIYLAITIPPPSLKTAFMYPMIFLLMGGRQILPPIVWQTYSNWQLNSIKKVISRVENNLQTKPSSQLDISFIDLKLERDAHLLLGSQIIELFINKNLSNQYFFHYDIESQTLKAYLK